MNTLFLNAGDVVVNVSCIKHIESENNGASTLIATEGGGIIHASASYESCKTQLAAYNLLIYPCRLRLPGDKEDTKPENESGNHK